MNERIRAVKKSVRSEEEEERRSKTSSSVERERESDGAVGGDYRLEQQHSSYTSPILYLAQSFHYSLSTLLNRVYRRRLGKKSGKNKGDRRTETGERGREGEKKKKESIRTRERVRERGAELFCSVAMETHRPELQRADSCHGTAGCHG